MALLSKTKWLALPLLGLSIAAASAEELTDKQLAKLEKDMNIMSRILQTTLEEDSDNGDRARIKSLYLAKQGMFFNVESRGGFHFEFKSFAMPVMAPVAMKPPLPPKVQIEVSEDNDIIFIEDEALAAAEVAMELAEESIERISEYGWSYANKHERHQQREAERALRNEQRKLESKARVLEREVRDIERKLRDAEFADELSNANEKSDKVIALKEEMAKLTEKLSGVARVVQEKSAEIQKRAAEIKQKQIEKQKQELVRLENAIAQVVCDFGPGLRSLPNQQNMTFSIEGQDKSQIYVFSKRSIDACGNDEIDSKKLLSSAIKYAM